MALAAQLAFGQTPSETPAGSWSEVLESAWQRARERAESNSQLQRAQAERTVAQSLWAAPPAWELDHRTGRAPTGGSARETELGVFWPVWLPGQKQSRLDAAEADLLATRRAIEAARLRLAGELQQSALAVAAGQAVLRQAELQQRLLQALAEDVERRVGAGDLARADAMAANAELLQAQAARQEAAQALQQARERWLLLTGTPAIPPLPARSQNAVPGDHPELSAAMARVERAQRRLEATAASRREPPEVGVRVRRDTDSTGSANSVGVSLRVPFATENRNAPALAQARGELDLALLEEQRVRDRLALETQSARLQVQSASQQLDAERRRASLLRQRAELIDRSFQAGETALPELLRAMAAAAQAQAGVVRQQAAFDQAQARLSQSLGLLP